MSNRLDDQYQQFRESLTASVLATWQDALPADALGLLNPYRHGNLVEWLQALERLPAPSEMGARVCRLDTRHVSVTTDQATQRQLHAEVEHALRSLMPWRKGPYSLLGVEIDSEWRSDKKWDRLIGHIEPLSGRMVLDVGCGNGYHMWRALGAGAKRAVGVDPTALYLVQFAAVRHLMGDHPIQILPYGLEDLPRIAVFDTVFSMGVLYHRRDPMSHLQELRECLHRDGELVLETLVVEGDAQTVLVPEDRYAKMRNVWFIPSVAMLKIWLARVGFTEIRCVDVTPTTTDEQRCTDWTGRHSLADFLDPDDPGRTADGYPGPLRAIVTAKRRY